MDDKRPQTAALKTQRIAHAAAILRPTVSDKGVVSVSASHVLKTAAVKRQLEAVREVRMAVAKAG